MTLIIDQSPHMQCYIGRTDNPSFIGSEPLDVLADTIWRCVGPSGKNKDYLYKLAEAIRKLAPESHDPHLHALEVSMSIKASMRLSKN